MGGTGSGRPSKPHELKVIEGRAKRKPDAVAAAVDDIKPRMPKAPASLSPAGKKVWRNVGSDLFQRGLLEPLYQPAFQLFCEACARYNMAREAMEVDGYIIKSPSGYGMLSPYHSIMRASLDQMTKIMSDFGMTPRTRAGVAAVAIRELLKPEGSEFFE